ncbi:MAG: DsrE/DsrF/DrsH-like family protein [Desulfobacterales bacterium]|nr:DsrE/DsrF/DrsH-like family protein [Desulfobacterales bacterium]
MLPASSRELAPSKMAFGGMGRKFFNYVMKGEMSLARRADTSSRSIPACTSRCARRRSA